VFARTHQPVRTGRARGYGEEGEGQGGADARLCPRERACLHADAWACPCEHERFYSQVTS
jgi:hypothetical protein